MRKLLSKLVYPIVTAGAFALLGTFLTSRGYNFGGMFSKTFTYSKEAIFLLVSFAIVVVVVLFDVFKYSYDKKVDAASKDYIKKATENQEEYNKKKTQIQLENEELNKKIANLNRQLEESNANVDKLNEKLEIANKCLDSTKKEFNKILEETDGLEVRAALKQYKEDNQL